MLEPIIIKKKKRFRGLKKALQSPYFWLVDLVMKRKNYIFTNPSMSSKFYLPYVKTDFIQRYVYRKKSYFEQDNLDYICKKWNDGVIERTIRKSLVLDIGANIGNHTLYYLNECGAKSVCCFEPVPDTFEILKRNIEINNMQDRVQLHNAAVGETVGKASVTYYSQSNTGMSTIEKNTDGNIKMISVDDMKIEERIGLVKIDVEGFEIPVLKGMINTLKSNLPYISMEVDDEISDDVVKMLTDIGYKMLVISKSPNYRDCLFYA